MEAAVARTLADALRDPLELATRLEVSLAPDMVAIVWQRCAELTGRLEHPARHFFEPLLPSVIIAANGLSILLNDDVLAEVLGTEIAAYHPGLTLSVAARLTRSGRVLRLVREDERAASTTAPNGLLISLLAQARAWNSQIRHNGADITTLAAESGKSKSYVSRVVRLAYLAPDVIAAMLSGTQRAAIGTDVLTLPDGVPLSWVEQRRKFMAAQERADG